MCLDHTPEVPQFKQCSKCKEYKPATLEYFSRHKREKDGLQYYCKSCVSAYRAANRERLIANDRAYYAENKERINEQNRVYHHANKERANQRSRDYYQAHKEHWKAYAEINKDRIAERTRIYRQANKERRREQGRKWIAANRERANTLVRNRNARKAAAPGRHTAEDVRRQYKAQKGKCYYCSAKVGKKYHVDHVIPLSRGGSDGPENIVVACPTCNTSKHDRLPHEWPMGNRLL